MKILKILFGNVFTDRELGLLYDCMKYASARPPGIVGPAGLPGHNLIIIIVKLFRILMKVSLGLTEDRAEMMLGKGIELDGYQDQIDRQFIILCGEDKE